MRILKKRIFQANKDKKIPNPLILQVPPPKELAQLEFFKYLGDQEKVPKLSITTQKLTALEEQKATKNIAKNYGQAICSFAINEYSE